MIAYLSKRERKIFFACVLLAFIYIAQYWVIGPMVRYRLSLDAKINTAQMKIYKNLRMIRKSELLKADHGEHLTHFKQTVPEGEVMSTLISEIETIASGLFLSIADLKPQKVRNDQSLNYFSISLKFNSNFKTLVHFLHTLQSREHLFHIEELQIDKTGARESDTLKAHLILNKIFIAE